MKMFFFIGGLVFFVAVAIVRNAPMLITAEPTPTAAAQQPTPTAMPTLAPVTTDPVRVQFKRGAWGETIIGGTGAKYLLWAAQGQTFTTTLTSNSTALVSLYAPDGKPLYEQMAAGHTAAAKLPANGDYTLEVRSSGAFTLGVEIR